MKKIQIPKRPLLLKVGMRVKALSMGRLVGDYIVVSTYGNTAFLAIRGDVARIIVACVSRNINPANNSVKVLSGQKVQCTDYYYCCDEEE